MYVIDLQSRTPIYEQLYRKITELILRNELKANEQLPSVRALAKELGVNPNTVSKAYQELERNGIIYSLAGRGSFVSDANIENLKKDALEKFAAAAKEALSAGISVEELTEYLEKQGEKL